MASKRQIFVGGVPIGGGAPVAVQTMTKTETANLAATMEQIRKVADAGADIVRVAVPRDDDVEALRTIVKESPIPVIADIHFNHTLALKAIDAGAHCIRLNPGNIGGREKVAEVAAKATAAGVPMRIGVNSGSLPKHLHELEREAPVEALVAAAVEFVELMEGLDFTDFKVSIKSTNVPNTLADQWPVVMWSGSTGSGPIFFASWVRETFTSGTSKARPLGRWTYTCISLLPTRAGSRSMPAAAAWSRRSCCSWSWRAQRTNSQAKTMMETIEPSTMSTAPERFWSVSGFQPRAAAVVS